MTLHHNRRGVPAAARLVALLPILIVVSACSAPASHAQLPEQNVDQWVLPLDQYQPSNIALADYAENLLVEPCMEKAGYEWAVPWRDTNAVLGPTWNSVTRRLFDKEIAEQYGYHTAGSTDSSKAAWQAFNAAHADISEAESQQLDVCLKAARNELPRPSGQVELVGAFVNTAYSAALLTNKVIKAAAAWHECMIPVGVSDLPENPADMPPQSVAPTSPSARDQPPSPEEIRVAVADADCRVESGYTDAVYQEEWDQQVAIVNQNGDTLARVAEEVGTNRQDVLDVIAQHAPIAPVG